MSSRRSASISIVAQGGWPVVPATKKLKLGVDRSRRRDAAQAPDDFGRPVDQRRHLEGLRHLCRCGGEALPGPPRPAGRRGHRQVHLCCHERQRAGSPRPARDEPGAAALHVRLPRRPLRDGQHPGCPDRGGREDRVVLRHTAIVGKIDRQTPILNSKINEIIVNPYWNAPESIVRKDIIPLMRKDPEYLPRTASASSRLTAPRSTRRRSTGTPRTRQSTCCARIRAPATRWPR